MPGGASLGSARQGAQSAAHELVVSSPAQRPSPQTGSGLGASMAVASSTATAPSSAGSTAESLRSDDRAPSTTDRSPSSALLPASPGWSSSVPPHPAIGAAQSVASTSPWICESAPSGPRGTADVVIADGQSRCRARERTPERHPHRIDSVRSGAGRWGHPHRRPAVLSHPRRRATDDQPKIVSQPSSMSTRPSSSSTRVQVLGHRRISVGAVASS
jgi:hypothetical protein